MALVELSGAITAIRGKVGGSTFQGSAAGQILKGKCTPVNPNTPRQNLSRSITFSLTQEWGNLTDAQRSNWQGYANYFRIGQQRNNSLFINGRQAFLKVNNYRLHYNIPLLTNPTFNKCDLTPVDITLSIPAGNLTATLDRPAVPAEEFIILFVSQVRPITWNTPQGSLKLIIFTTLASATQDISTEYSALYGSNPVSGDTIFFKYTNADLLSGRVLPFASKKVTFP